MLILTFLHSGLVIAMIEGNQGVLFEANCETDFVSKNPDFIDFTKQVAQMIVKESPADVATLSAMPMGGKSKNESENDKNSSSSSLTANILSARTHERKNCFMRAEGSL
jgi:translation elongation factor EF-Ts